VLSTMQRDHGSSADLARAFAKAYVAGLAPFATLPRNCNADLGPFPWQRTSYWVDATRRRGTQRGGLDVALLPAVAEQDAWEGMLEIGLEENPWLQDHKVHDAVV